MLLKPSKKSLMHLTTNKVLKAFGFVFILLYPFCIFLMLKRGLSLRFMSLLLFVLILSSFLRSGKKVFLYVGFVLITGLLLFNNDLFLRLYPVCMNFIVCLSFWLSLREKPLVTLFAEKMGHKPDKNMLSYTKKATIAWAIFMTVNTVVSIITLFTNLWFWTLYNGLISYILIGIMFIAEYLIRRRRINESV